MSVLRISAPQMVDDLLAPLGLEPRYILAEEWDEKGYWYALHDDEGHILRDGDEDVLKEWRTWPKGVDFVRLGQLVWAMGLPLPSSIDKTVRDSLNVI